MEREKQITIILGDLILIKYEYMNVKRTFIKPREQRISGGICNKI